MPYKRDINSHWDFETANTKELTHGYIAYPAMMIPQVARTLLEEYSPTNCRLLLDPYMGSGTSLIEASTHGVDSIGTDINPLARFISRTKTTHYNETGVEKVLLQIEKALNQYKPREYQGERFKRITNPDFWYSPEVLMELQYIDDTISEFATQSNANFFRLVLAEIVRECSYTRNGEFKRYRMTEKQIENFHPSPFVSFLDKTRKNFEGLKAYNSMPKRGRVSIMQFNSTYGIPRKTIAPQSVDMVITSPPYGDSRTTVAYGQFSRWANEWFGFDNAKNLDKFLMGGKACEDIRFSSSEIEPTLLTIKEKDVKRYWDVISFLNDYAASIRNVAETIRNGGRVCYVVGNRRVKSCQLELDYFTAELFEQNGFNHITTIVRKIPNKRMPSKTSPSNISGSAVETMSNEYIVIMEKKQGI